MFAWVVSVHVGGVCRLVGVGRASWVCLDGGVTRPWARLFSTLVGASSGVPLWSFGSSSGVAFWLAWGVPRPLVQVV